jgi:hypothetical protein
MDRDRALLPVMIASITGVVVMVIANQVGHGGDLLSPMEYLAPKGVVIASVTALAVFGVARLLSSSAGARSWGWLLAAILSGVFGLLVLNWNVMWGVPPLTLEGAWLWPLAIVLLVLCFVSLVRWRRTRRADEARAESALTGSG